MQRYKKYLIYANFWGVEGGKPENPDRPDRCAHPEPCGEESGQLYCPETTKKEKYKERKRNTKKEIYANFWGVEGGKPENPDRPDRCAHPNHAERRAGNYIALKLPRKKIAEKENSRERKILKRNAKKEKYKEIPRKKKKEKERKRNTKKEISRKQTAAKMPPKGTKEKGKRRRDKGCRLLKAFAGDVVGLVAEKQQELSVTEEFEACTGRLNQRRDIRSR